MSPRPSKPTEPAVTPNGLGQTLKPPLELRVSRRRSADGALSPLHAHIGRQVAEYRTSRGWTLTEMADELGFGRATVADLEHGRQDLALTRLMRVAEVLGVDLSELLALDLGRDAGRTSGR